jgi:5-methylcytosine-specific restriction endonuclease McrA
MVFVEYNILNKSKAIRKETILYNGFKYGKSIVRKSLIYVFNCSNCGSELKVQVSHIKKHQGRCVICGQLGKPYYHIYRELVKSQKKRKRQVFFTYEDFIDIIKNNKCHYCLTIVNWNKHTRIRRVAVSRAYQLDRKDNSKDYSLDNVVVCCWKCNSSKGNRYTYEEWFNMTKYFRNKAISLEEAKKRFTEKHSTDIISIDDCPTGVCDI